MAGISAAAPIVLAPPRLRRSRIPPTEDNPAGYPPFEVTDVVRYSNRQIQHYVRQGAIPAEQMAAFTEATEQRRRIKDALRQSGDTTDEEPSDREAVHTPRTSVRTPRSASLPGLDGTWSYEADGEPDSD